MHKAGCPVNTSSHASVVDIGLCFVRKKMGAYIQCKNSGNGWFFSLFYDLIWFVVFCYC